MLLDVTPGRFALALSVHEPPFALGGPHAIDHALEDIGFSDVRVWSQGEILPPRALAMLAPYSRAFPAWLTYAEATWTRSRAELSPATELFEILAAKEVPDTRVSVPPRSEPPPLRWVIPVLVLIAGTGLGLFLRELSR